MLGGTFDKNKLKDKIKNFDTKILQENFWKDKLTAQKILKEKKFFGNILENYNFTINELENLEQLLELAASENNFVVIKDCEKKINLLFNQIKKDKVSDFELNQMKINTKSLATNYLNKIMINYDFDIFISVDNSMAGIAAAAHFPALTIPMGYRNDGQPSNITFITTSKNEQLLYNIAYRYEKQSKRRVAPKKYN